MRQELPPTLQILFGTFYDSQDIPRALSRNPYGHQYRNVVSFPGPTPFKADPVQVHIGMRADEGRLAPLVDTLVELLTDR